MPSIIKADDGVISGKTGIVTTADNSGTLEFQAISGVIEMDNVTGALALPKGTTAQRPGTSITGMQRWNTTTGSIEVYNGTAWGSVGGGGGAGAWQSVKTSGFTAVSGEAYACNTTSAAFTVTLPASPAAGNYVQLVDYAGTWTTNNLTIDRNGSNINGSAANVAFTINRQAVAIVYIDATQGWICYSQGANIGQYTASYLAVAGGGGGAADVGGGGGAGGLLTASISFSSGTSYAITIGAGGPAQNTPGNNGNNGSNSVIASIATLIGGGGGGAADQTGRAGGSGGGGGRSANAGGAATAGQGFAGGNGTTFTSSGSGGGGGGAGAVGASNNSGPSNGGTGVSSALSGSSTFYGGGGGGGSGTGAGSGGTGGAGGGANGGAGSGSNGGTATANTGGGGGGGSASSGLGGAGGSGIVIISYVGAQRGTGGTVTSSGGNTIHTFTTSGTYTG
jgi:hypothetical protein